MRRRHSPLCPQMRSPSPPAQPTTQASQPGVGASTPRVAAGGESGLRPALSAVERVLAALAYRETGAAFLPDGHEAAPYPRTSR